MLKNKPQSTLLLVSLLLIDTILITLHFFHRLAFHHVIYSPFLSNTIFSMSEEAKLPDLFQYLKQFAIVLLLLYTAIKKDKIYWAWTAIFAYLMLDDELQFHENIGFAFGYIAPHIGNIDPSEFIQEIFLVFLSVVLFAAALFIIWRAKGEARIASIHLTILLAAAAFFGVFVDIIQSIVGEHYIFSGIIKIVEDGGEMLIISVIVWYVYRLVFETIPLIDFTPATLLHTKTRFGGKLLPTNLK